LLLKVKEYDRNYNRSPYGSYNKNKTTYFPTAFKSEKYHPKERVMGVTINNKQKVYPFSELSKTQKITINDQFQG